jgi:gamma-glutamylcyclotransferase (GGCT)/AIG2-like uncharacterized protein YtfP
MKAKTKRKSRVVEYSYTMGRILYFAYGSNMSQERLEQRIGPVKKTGTVAVHYYRLSFNCGMPERRFINIVNTGLWQDVVEGVLYELTPEQLQRLNTFEGYPGCYQKLVIETTAGEAYTYICLNPQYKPHPTVAPSEEYITHIMQGCKENNLHRPLQAVQWLWEQHRMKGIWF